MKPHFLPGDQVMLAGGITGDVTKVVRSAVTGTWIITTRVGSLLVTRPEREVWHLDGQVARQRAYARKGKLPPEREAPLRGPTDGDVDGNVLSVFRGAAVTLGESADLPLSAVIHDTMAQTGQSPHALHLSHEGGPPPGPLPVIPSEEEG